MSRFKMGLGAGIVAPVERFARDHATPIPGNWFCWNVGNVNSAFLGEQSGGVMTIGQNQWMMMDPNSLQPRCSAKTVAGPDAWYDPGLHDVLFLSAGLGDATTAAGMATQKAGFGELVRAELI